MKDSITTVKEITQQETFSGNNIIWIIAAIIVSISVVLLVIRLYAKRKKKIQLKKEVLKETANSDFSDVTHNWEKSKQLYEILKKKCHPDKFSEDLNKEATRIFQLIEENKYNYKRLLSIRKEAIEKLGIELTE